jgi:hypothetical protein
MTAARTMTIPDANFTAARTDAGNTFTGHQTVEGVTSTGATGTGKFVFDGSPTLVTPTLGVATGTRLGLGAAADGTFEFLLEADALGVTANHGAILKNTTAAAAGAQQYSPVIIQEGQGWKTTATASQPKCEVFSRRCSRPGHSEPNRTFRYFQFHQWRELGRVHARRFIWESVCWWNIGPGCEHRHNAFPLCGWGAFNRRASDPNHYEHGNGSE